jgi:hypothetical protein
VSDELTLFGKAMDPCVRAEDGYALVRVADGTTLQIGICDSGWELCFNYGEDRVFLVRNPVGSFAASRDDAELALRELYAALGELIEPWITDRDPPPPACSTCDYANLLIEMLTRNAK